MTRFLRGNARALVPLAVVLVYAACDTFGPADRSVLRDQLRASEQLWRERGAPGYALEMTRCPIDPRQVRLEIVNDQIVAATYTDTDEPVDAADVGTYPTVTGLFDLVRDALSRTVASLNIAYNQDFGYVEELAINYDRSRLDDDVLISVDSYTPAEP